MKKKQYLLSITLLILSSNLLSAESGAVDFLRSTGKIYAVVAVVLVVFIGLVLYLFRLDRKISKLEKQITNEEKQ